MTFIGSKLIYTYVFSLAKVHEQLLYKKNSRTFGFALLCVM